MLNNFTTIQEKLEQFIRRYYTNELLKGAILFFAIGLLYLLFTLFIEYVLWLNPTARTILFWVFVFVELLLFVKFIAIPLARLFKLQKGINFEDASKIIGQHFPEVNDKLLNVLQLKSRNIETDNSELLLASIEQKSAELQPIPFKLAVNFHKNVKYLKYAAIPVLVLLLIYITGHFNLFSDSYERVVNYKTAYEPPAPFQFFVVNERLQAIENKDYKLLVKTTGTVIPENAQIHYNGETYFLQQTAPGQFEYLFSQPKDAIDFNLSANSVTSKAYILDVVKVPTLVNFEMVLDYPSYTNKPDEILKSTGSATIPEGTSVTWKVSTRSTNSVALYGKDTLNFENISQGEFEASKRIYQNLDYTISTSNEKLKNYENLAFSINVIRDDFPEINLKVEKDSLDNQTLYFYGQISDDYGLSKLQLVYYPSNKEERKNIQKMPIASGNFDEFVTAFPNNLQLEEGVNYELYFQVFDNDAIHSYKSTKSSLFTYRKLTQEEEEQKQLKEQNETIKDMGKSFEKLKEQEQQIKELSKTQKEKNELNFNDKKKFENFLQRQKQQEEMMQNFNKKLKENLENFQLENEQKDQFKEDLKERLKDNEEQLKKDEKLLEELEKLKDKIEKEELSEKLEQLAKQNKNKQKSLEQLLELTKRYYVAKKAEKLLEELNKLGEEQEKQSEKIDENSKEAQEELNKKFEEFQKQMEDLQKENKELKKPLDVPQDKETEKEIETDQQEATEELEQQEQNEQQNDQKKAQQNQQKAQKKQKDAGKKMKQMSGEMKQSMMSGGGDQMSEDAATLRQILDNLVLFSFDQESLMNQFRSIQINNNEYGKFLRKQSSLREHFEHIDDSLFALSLRQPMISETVNTKITDVFFNIDKSLGQLSENQLYQGVSTQQYTITATNDLASFLSDVLDNMEAQMNQGQGQGQGQGVGMGKGQGGGMQLPDIIMSQEELNKQMEEGMKKGESGKPKDGKGKEGKSGEGNEGGEGENGKDKGTEGKPGKNGKDGTDGKQDGDGEGSSEELNGELYQIYQQQQQLRQALENKLGEAGTKGEGKMLLQKMEDIEMDLLNKGFTNQTLQKMMDLQHRLLKLENASFLQDEDNTRKAESNTKQYNNDSNDQIPTAKEYFNTTEILNRQALPLLQVYKMKVQEYFKKSNDQL